MNFSYLENTFVQLFQCPNQCWVDKIYLKYFLLFLGPRTSGVRNQACVNVWSTVASILGIMCNSGTKLPQTQSYGTLKIDRGPRGVNSEYYWLGLGLTLIVNTHSVLLCRHILYVPAEAPVGDVNISILCWAQTADITTLARLGWAGPNCTVTQISLQNTAHLFKPHSWCWLVVSMA